MNPLTATLSIRLVVALYSVRRIVKFPLSRPSPVSVAKGASPSRQVCASAPIELWVVTLSFVPGEVREKER